MQKTQRLAQVIRSGWIVVGGVLLVTLTGRAAQALEDRRSGAVVKAPMDSSRKSSEATVEQKLDQILAKQDQILARFDEVMEELQIIKIRATMQ